MTDRRNTLQAHLPWRAFARLCVTGFPLTLGVAGAVGTGSDAAPSPTEPVTPKGDLARSASAVEAKVRMTGFVTEAPTAEMCALLGGQLDPRTSTCIVSTDADSCRARGVDVRSDSTCSLPASPCAVQDSQLGLCIDVATFQNPEVTISDHDSPTLDAALSQAYWSNAGHLTSRILDDIAQRWGRKKDSLSEVLLGFGVTTMPSAASLWGTTANSSNVFAIPDPKVWLGESEWVASSGSPAIFRTVNALIPSSNSTAADAALIMPNTVLLRGRFASGITHNGTPMPFDLFDANPSSIAPFLRQFFPYPTSKTERTNQDSRSCRDTEIPLSCFDLISEIDKDEETELSYRSIAKTGTHSAQEIGAMKAHDEFQRFSDLIGARLLQYGRREASSTHTRILAALIAMTSPPNLTPRGRAQLSETNSSVEGQNDQTMFGDATETARLTGDSTYWRPAQSGDERIDYGTLPDEVIRASLDEFGLDETNTATMRCLQSGPSGNEWLDHLVTTVRATQLKSSPLLQDERRAKAELGELNDLNHQTQPLAAGTMSRQQALLSAAKANAATVDFYRVLRTGSDGEIRTILHENAYGNRQEQLNLELDRLLLMRVVEDACLTTDISVPDEPAATLGAVRLRTRAQNRSRILMKHVEMELRQSLPAPNVKPATPQELIDYAWEAWTEVLSLHGPPPDVGQELPGNINPIAVCVDPAKLSAFSSPIERRDAALADPVFRRIHVDALLVAPKGLSGGDALWQARDSVPFVFIDDPEMNSPEVEPLIAISATHEIYRVRWEVWTGWHLLWGIARPEDRKEAEVDRLDLRVGALCDDMVFAPEALLPTLVRAGLLEGAMRGTTPAERFGAVPPPPSAPSTDAFVEHASHGIEQTQDSVSEMKTARATMTSDPSALVEKGGEGALSALQKPPTSEEGPADSPSAAIDPLIRKRLEAVDYLRDLILTPLRELDGERPFLLITFDTVISTDHRATDGLRPHSPYRHRQVRVGKELWLRSAAWATLIYPAPSPGTPPTPDAPFREPRVPMELALNGIVRPTWRRTHPIDFTLGTDLGFTPLRMVQLRCSSPDAELFGVVADCGLLHDGQPGTPDSRILSTGSSLGLSSLATVWLLDSPHVAVDFGAVLQLDVFPEGEPWGGRWPAYAPIPYARDIAPGFGVVAGVRWAPDPFGMRRALPRARSPRGGAPSAGHSDQSRLRMPWGADGADGSSHLQRMQLGVRGGFGMEPFAFNNVSFNVGAETWMAWSVRNNRAPWANVTPYRPNILLGPYLQWQRSAPWPSAEPSTDYLSLKVSQQLTAGVRVQLRLSQNTVKLPESP